MWRTGNPLEPGAAWLAVLVLPGVLAAQPEEPVEYELVGGSTILDACEACDRIPVERAISGTFVLQFLESHPGATNYSVTEVSFTDATGDCTVTGRGNYRVLTTFPTVAELELEVEVNGVGGIQLASRRAPVEALWPVIDVVATEPKARDPMHIYTVRLIAAPRPIRWHRYALVKGSALLDDCRCGRPAISVELEGSFILGELALSAYPIFPYVIDDLIARSQPPGAEYDLLGGGVYEQGGEVAIVQKGRLAVQVNGALNFVDLVSSAGPPLAPWPAIDIEFTYDDGLQIYVLHLVAEEASSNPVPFRRGDGNADGRLDIADAVHTLMFLFAGGEAPPCKDATDANDNGGIDIGDAVRVLMHLFLKDGPLPSPFESCGFEADDELECLDFPPCR